MLHDIHFQRYPVPADLIRWSVSFPTYTPFNFTSEKILLKDGRIYKDPDMYIYFAIVCFEWARLCFTLHTIVVDWFHSKH